MGWRTSSGLWRCWSSTLFVRLPYLTECAFMRNHPPTVYSSVLHDNPHTALSAEFRTLKTPGRRFVRLFLVAEGYRSRFLGWHVCESGGQRLSFTLTKGELDSSGY